MSPGAPADHAYYDSGVTGERGERGEPGRTYIGSYALCVRDGRVLLTRLSSDRLDGGQWTLPGGGVEWGESPGDGALRELEEETGLTGTLGGVAGVYSKVYEPVPERRLEPLHHIGIVFWVEVNEGEVRHEVFGSTDFCAWVPVSELDSLALVPLAAFAAALIGAQG